MAVDDRPTKVLLENKKYRILKIDALSGKAHRFDMCVRTSRLRLQVEGTLAKLEQRCWFFGWHWQTLGVTNVYSVAEEWVETYFKEKHNEAGKE